MKEHQVHGKLRQAALEAMQRSPLFKSLGNADREIVLSHGRVLEYEAGERVVDVGDRSETFFVILKGGATVFLPQEGAEARVEVTRLKAFDSIGEMGLLLGQERTASVAAESRLFVLEFDLGGFDLLLNKVNGFAQQLCRILASRLANTSRMLEIPTSPEEHIEAPSAEVVGILPAGLIERHQVLPLSLEGDSLRLGFVHDPAPQIISAVQRLLPGVQIQPVRIPWQVFDDALRSRALEEPPRPAPSGELPPPLTPAASHEERLEAQKRKLHPILMRMVAEGASDLHLCATQKPRWRIHGEMHTIADAREVGTDEVFALLEPALSARARKEFEAERDVDFTYAADDIARFRVNMYEDDHGVSAVLRIIPLQIPSMSQIGLPHAAQALCRTRTGLILVCGHTGSGKSTTLAAMIDSINRTRRQHIITLEDPIEFVHDSQAALVNQREIGAHANSFARALRAAMRQDPDIVLVGEMRDLDTIRLAVETANTGHLVFGTLHTSSAVGSVDRMVDLYPADERDMARSLLAEVLRGVIAQTLCRRNTGGRVAAFEVLVVDPGVANLIRQGKTHQIASALTTGKARGNQALNDHLQELAKRSVISPEEAFHQSTDREDMKKRLG